MQHKQKKSKSTPTKPPHPVDVASESEENAPAKPSAVVIHAHSTHVSHTTAGEWEQPPLTFAICGGENRAQQLQNANDEERGAAARTAAEAESSESRLRSSVKLAPVLPLSSSSQASRGDQSVKKSKKEKKEKGKK